MPIPESIEIYPGTSGNTHGDKNEISPARNAPAKETSVIPDSSSLQAHTLWNISRQVMLFRRTQTATTPNCLVGQRCFKGRQVYKGRWLPGNQSQKRRRAAALHIGLRILPYPAVPLRFRRRPRQFVDRFRG